MKFTDGFWRNRKGVSVYNAAKVYDLEVDEDSITCFASHFNVTNRGQTLWGPLLTYRFSSPLPGIIRVQSWHFKGAIDKNPSFEMSQQEGSTVFIKESEEDVRLISGDLSVSVSKGEEWSVDFYDGDRLLTNSRGKNSGYVVDEKGAVYMKEQLALGVGECVYGLGERFTPFVKNGQSVDIWNADGGTSSELAYKNIPFYITNKGYGVLVNDTGCVSFEVASEKVSRVQFSVPGEYIDYYVINGPTIKKVLERYTALTGRSALPPAWSFGLWLTTSFITSYDERTVTDFIEGMAKRDLPLHVFHFDCFWMKEYNWCDFRWDERVFPDPAAMLKRLKDRGLKICVWINPYIAQRSYLFEEGRQKGFLLKKPDGSVWQCDDWQPGMGLVDFTNPDACMWFKDKLAVLLEMGVDCFKTDFGERIPTDAVYSDGSDPVKMHNYYTHLYNKTVFEVVGERKGKGEALVFARSAAVGGQKFPVHWGGDCTANYESMAESLRGGLSLCMSGFGFWSHDISGFELTATPDLYKRWVAFGMLSTHSRLHGNASYRVPWLFDEEAVDVLRYFTKLKCSLMPYIFSAAREASDRGIPVMRAMVVEFMNDPACDYLDRQYMLGGSLLVAPVFSDNGTVTYYLPEGLWTNYLTGEEVPGGRWISEKHGYMSIPLFVRPGSMIAVGKEDKKPDYDFADGVVLHVFGLAEGSTASTVVYGLTGEPELQVTVKCLGKAVHIEAKGIGKCWSICLRGIHSAKATEGIGIVQDKKGILFTPDKVIGSFDIALG